MEPSLQRDVALAPLTTFEVGGPARFFVEARTEDEVRSALAWARAQAVPVAVLGGGSNVLVSDRGFEGLVLRVAVGGLEVPSEGSNVLVYAGAGEVFDKVVEACVLSGLGGLECLSGIPGIVGATPVQNVGAYGQEVGACIHEVRAIDRSTGALSVLGRSACAFAYRTSVFKGELRDRFVIVGVSFALERSRASSLHYGDLARRLRDLGVSTPTLGDVREAVLTIRREKSMVLEPSDPNRRSAGSFFLNPVVSPAAADVIDRAAGCPVPKFQAEGGVKLSAAWLIEHAGFRRGSGDGPVGLSTRHALAIVNRGGALAAEVLRFALQVQRGVEERFGVRLGPEPSFVGFEPEELAPLGIKSR